MRWLLQTGLWCDSCEASTNIGLWLFLPVSLKISLKKNTETTALVYGMYGLFEPVFPLTTNKYSCQSLSVYLARLSGKPCVFS